MKKLKDWEKFNDDDSKARVEGRYLIDEKTLYVYLEPTNCRGDWLRNLFGWIKPERVSPFTANRYWWKNAEFVARFIEELDKSTRFNQINLIGYSKGGAEAVLTAVHLSWFICCSFEVLTIASPIAKTGLNKAVRVSRKGDIVPKLPVPGIGTFEEDFVQSAVSRLFWKNHIWTKDQIDDVIKEWVI